MSDVKFNQMWKVVAAVLILAGALILLQIPKEEELKLVRVVKGEEAVELIKRIHEGSFEILDGEIREYEGTGKIRVWVATTKSPEEAKAYVEEMAAKVAKYFSPPVYVEEVNAYRVYGMGRTHYFFSKGSQVIWIEFERKDEEYHIRVIKQLFFNS